jgi:hypothetical protein
LNPGFSVQLTTSDWFFNKTANTQASLFQKRERISGLPAYQGDEKFGEPVVASEAKPARQ